VPGYRPRHGDNRDNLAADLGVNEGDVEVLLELLPDSYQVVDLGE
jgi:hypothetical protein